MIVVVDAGPLIHLSWLSRLDLLPSLYGTLLAPEAVWREAVEEGAGRFRIDELRNVDWLDVRSDPDPQSTALVTMHLDEGERAAIALAQQVSADLLLCDDRQARRAAASAGLTVMGTLGVLLQAKLAGHLEALTPMVDELLRGGFFISRDVIDAVLRAAGEH